MSMRESPAKYVEVISSAGKPDAENVQRSNKQQTPNASSPRQQAKMAVAGKIARLALLRYRFGVTRWRSCLLELHAFRRCAPGAHRQRSCQGQKSGLGA